MDNAGGGDPRFAVTQWSLVRQAGGGSTPEARAALTVLCQRYWFPLYSYLLRHLRHTGRAEEDAKDLVQAFFAHLLEKDSIKRAQPEKGRFRNFLLGCLKRFVRDVSRTPVHQPVVISLEGMADEDGASFEVPDTDDPEKAFLRQWATSVLSQAHARLRQKYHATGKTVAFDRLQIYLQQKNTLETYAEVARELGLTEGAVKTEISRMRKAYGELVRLEIAQTVETAAEIDDELRCLFAAL